MAASKKQRKIIEIVIYSVFGALAVWGLILFGVFGALTAAAFAYFAKDIDKDYEKSQRRAARLRRNNVTEKPAEEVVDAKVE